MPYWLTDTLAALPAVLWVYFGIGIPWALALLPRRNWRSLPMVLCVAFAVGPALLTAWMLVLGTVAAQNSTPLLQFNAILAGTVVIAVIGTGAAWRKRKPAPAQGASAPHTPFQFDEKLILVLIAAALIIRWLATAFWSFTAYDALWVYGYQGRLYFVEGVIPNTIDYYPQFLQLQFTYAQLAVGAINDHAARAVLPLLHLGSVLAAYVLGSRLFTRRVGLFVAGIWALHPHLGEWARFGDLEVPLAFLFTATSAFFLMAWLAGERRLRRQYAWIAGLLFGIAMWTKPTAGAFIWGVVLLVITEFWRVRGDWRAWYPRFEVALITGLACLPLGAVWYVRNLLLGHNAIDFPPSFWLTQAARSGVEFGWLLLALFALLGWLRFSNVLHLIRWRRIALGLGLLLAGIVPSILATYHPQWIAWLNLPSFAPPHRMSPIEWLLTIAGSVVLWRTFANSKNPALPDPAPQRSSGLFWALLLAAPYFVTWFYSYSYHYRLSFAIVPLLILPTAVILAAWLTPLQLARWQMPRRLLYGTLIVLLALPGIALVLYDKDAGWDWLWSGELPDDHAKYTVGNPALMAVVDGLQVHLDNDDPRPLVVAAPNMVRLPFFFPEHDIRTEPAPMTFADVEDVVYFVYGIPEGIAAYENIPLPDKQLVAALGRAVYDQLGEDIIRKAWWYDDGGFNYVVYELDVAKRFVEPTLQPRPEGEVIFGGFVRLVAHATAGVEFWQGRRLINTWLWEVIAEPTADYVLYVHLLDAEGNLWAAWDGPLGQAEDLPGIYYTSLAWETGEYIFERRWLALQNPATPLGDNYRLVVGFYDAATQQRVPVTVDGVEAGDGYTINVIPVQVVEPRD